MDGESRESTEEEVTGAGEGLSQRQRNRYWVVWETGS